jgi:hypothetical protein
MTFETVERDQGCHFELIPEIRDDIWNCCQRQGMTFEFVASD